MCSAAEEQNRIHIYLLKPFSNIFERNKCAFIHQVGGWSSLKLSWTQQPCWRQSVHISHELELVRCSASIWRESFSDIPSRTLRRCRCLILIFLQNYCHLFVCVSLVFMAILILSNRPPRLGWKRWYADTGMCSISLSYWNLKVEFEVWRSNDNATTLWCFIVQHDVTPPIFNLLAVCCIPRLASEGRKPWSLRAWLPRLSNGSHQQFDCYTDIARRRSPA